MFDLFKRAPTDERRSWGERLRAGLEASRQRIAQPLAALMGRKELSEEALGALETALLSADVGVATTERLLADLRSRWLRAGADADPRGLLKASLATLLAPLERPFVVGPERPFVIMLAGVNGAGKTTSIGKLARSLQMQGHSVLLAAGDTFRAAAREQLQAWGERNRVQVIAQHGGDPAAVMFDAITGQNALAQVAAFDAALGLTGLVLTKLDGSAKGGVVAAIAGTRPVPLRFIGVGEGIEDLRPFVVAEFVEALLG